MDRTRAQSLHELGYELIDELGSGGMGKVWRARDLKLEREVAIKFIAAAAADERARQRFHVEARALARIKHPNVVVVYQLGELDGVPFLVYELVDGVSVNQLVGELSWPQALAIVTDLARGLAAAHEAGVLHRDLKPANAMVTSKGAAKLIDFGLAKLPDGRSSSGSGSGSGSGSPRGSVDLDAAAALLEDDSDAPTLHDDSATSTHPLMGTPRYLAPELWQGQAASERTDVYTLGLIAWELLSARRAHASLDGDALARAIVERPLAQVASLNPELPEELAAIVDRAVAKPALARFASAEELAAALEELADKLRALGLLTTHEGEPTLASGELGLVQRSLAMAMAKGCLVARFYERLFELDPDLRPLFPEQLDEQSIKLADALQLSVSSLDQPERLATGLEQLGARHYHYGVLESDLDTAGQALLDALDASTDEPMDATLRQAWERAWTALDRPVRRGLRRAQLAPTIDPSLALARPSVALGARPPKTRWIRAGELSLAMQRFGSGPVDVVFIPAWVSHCEVAWRLPQYAEFMTRLGRLARVTVFDKRGTGMSDRMNEPAPIEERMLDIAAILDACELDSAVLVGVQDGGVLASAFAATHPERARGLIWYAAAHRLLASPDYPTGMPAPMFEQICAAVLEHWGAPLFADFAAPSQLDDPVFLDWWSDYLRNGASPSAAKWMLELNATIDVSPVLPAIGAPTLLLHRRGDRMMPLPGGQIVAQNIAGARWVELDGDDHQPWFGDTQALFRPIATFLRELDALPRAPRRLVSLLARGSELRECAGPVDAIRQALAEDSKEPALIHVGASDRDLAGHARRLLARLRGLAGEGTPPSVVATRSAAFLAGGAGLNLEPLTLDDAEEELFVLR